MIRCIRDQIFAVWVRSRRANHLEELPPKSRTLFCASPQSPHISGPHISAIRFRLVHVISLDSCHLAHLASRLQKVPIILPQFPERCQRRDCPIGKLGMRYYCRRNTHRRIVTCIATSMISHNSTLNSFDSELPMSDERCTKTLSSPSLLTP